MLGQAIARLDTEPFRVVASSVAWSLDEQRITATPLTPQPRFHRIFIVQGDLLSRRYDSLPAVKTWRTLLLPTPIESTPPLSPPSFHKLSRQKYACRDCASYGYHSGVCKARLSRRPRQAVRHSLTMSSKQGAPCAHRREAPVRMVSGTEGPALPSRSERPLP